MPQQLLIASLAALVAGCGGNRSEITKLVDEPGTVTAFAADETGVAWLASGHDGVELKTRGSDGKIVIVAHAAFLTGVALDKDGVYWGDNSHLWRADRGTVGGKQIADVDDEPNTLMRDGNYLYWATRDNVGRVLASGGPTEALGNPVAHGQIKKIAVAETKVVAAITLDGGNSTELWRMDSEPRKIGAFSGETTNLVIDGARIWLALLGKAEEVASQPLDGGPPGPVVHGQLVAAGSGSLYVVPPTTANATYATYEVNADGTERRIAPQMTEGIIVGPRLYGVFIADKNKGVVIGSVPRH